jgi:hypothetical protein
VQIRTVFIDPSQSLTDVTGLNSAHDQQTVKLHRTFPTIAQLNMHMSKQMVTCVHHHARRRKFL